MSCAQLINYTIDESSKFLSKYPSDFGSWVQNVYKKKFSEDRQLGISYINYIITFTVCNNLFTYVSCTMSTSIIWCALNWLWMCTQDSLTTMQFILHENMFTSWACYLFLKGGRVWRMCLNWWMTTWITSWNWMSLLRRSSRWFKSTGPLTF